MGLSVEKIFDSESFEDRKMLAESIKKKLEDCGFVLDKANSYSAEDVYTRNINDSIQVKVYTSIVGIQVRPNGKDAIRVAGVYKSKDGGVRPLASETRINRVGKIDDIASRMHERMRSVWASCKSAEKCKCGAPKFTSSKGNLVCAEACWTKKENQS